MGQAACKCPEPQVSRNPKFIQCWLGVKNGDGKGLVQAYMVSREDVNVCTENGDTLMSTAAFTGQLEVINQLVISPYLHFNTYHPFEGEEGAYTPLWIAAAKGHLECVKFLQKQNLSCRIDLVGSKQRDISAVMVAAKNGHWEIVTEFLRHSTDLHASEANYIFPRAVENQQWFAIKITLAKCSHVCQDVLKKLLHKAMENNRWKIIYDVLAVKSRHRTLNILKALGKAVRDRNWEPIDHLMKLLPCATSYDRPFAEAVIAENYEESKRLATESNYTLDKWNGNLIIMAASGTSETIAEFVCSYVGFSQFAVEGALYLAALTGHLEVMQSLFTIDSSIKFSYNTLSVAHEAARENGLCNAERLLSKMLDKEAEALALRHYGKAEIRSK